MKYHFKNHKIVTIISVIVVLISLTWEVQADQSLSSSLGLVAYPAKGQTAEQQNTDEGQCFTWAKENTGIDPFAAASSLHSNQVQRWVEAKELPVQRVAHWEDWQ